MPNAWGQPQPWEVADLSHAEWMQVLRYTIKRWVAATDAMHNHFDKPGPITLEGFQALQREHDEAHDEHRRVMAGDPETCASIWERLRQSG
jgi:hypothetical protein